MSTGSHFNANFYVNYVQSPLFPGVEGVDGVFRAPDQPVSDAQNTESGGYSLGVSHVTEAPGHAALSCGFNTAR